MIYYTTNNYIDKYIYGLFSYRDSIKILDNDTNIQFNLGRRQQSVEQAGGPPRSSLAGGHSNVFSVDGAAREPRIGVSQRVQTRMKASTKHSPMLKNLSNKE